MRQAGYPPDPIEAWTGAVTVPGSEVILGTNSTAKNAVLLVEEAAAPATAAAEPGALPLFASEAPLLLKLDDLGLTAEGDGNLRPAQATGADDRVIFQQLGVGPFSRPSCAKGAHAVIVKRTYAPCSLHRQRCVHHPLKLDLDLLRGRHLFPQDGA